MKERFIKQQGCEANVIYMISCYQPVRTGHGTPINHRWLFTYRIDKSHIIQFCWNGFN